MYLNKPFNVTELDFSKPRVRFSGRALSRWDIACYLDCFKTSCNWTIIYDVYSYSELRDTLINYISEYSNNIQL